ncbi:MAG: hypothetical protein KME10_00005 [Plectolyngbya sp. WJT66-NPBG17]|jgi:hypothetical protein|nr:hypothetical protein [Plectolyngbya sp. WJT66-NPBG17]MBW4528190.1 hypothetical protein [Phormidium tanganyikae FI6-MK23]
MKTKSPSRALEIAQKRLSGLQSSDINAFSDLGYGITIQNFADAVEVANQQLDNYNKLLSSLEAAKITLADTDKDLAKQSEQMLMAVALKYGKDSQYYHLAGGVRLSDRKRSKRATRQTLETSPA